MTNTQYTTLTLSKLIAKKLPELKTEYYWVKHGVWEQVNSRIVEKEPEWRLEVWGCITGGHNYPALTFSDCLQAIKMLGEKKFPKVWQANHAMTIQHKFLDAYISDNLTIGKNTEEYLVSLLSEKNNHDHTTNTTKD